MARFVGSGLRSADLKSPFAPTRSAPASPAPAWNRPRGPWDRFGASSWEVYDGRGEPIVGPRTLEQLVDLLPVLGMSLTDGQRAACDAINPPGTALVNFHNTAAWMKAVI